MRPKHPVFDSNIDLNATIWRYFDYPKFTSMLLKQSLYFSRANLLGDPLEGSFTRAREAERLALLEAPPEGQTREYLELAFKKNAEIVKSLGFSHYINCWHLGDHESMAMWSGYGGGPYGIAIRSTFGILNDVIPSKFKGLNKEAPIYIGRVKYMDYSSENEHIPLEDHVYAPFMCKTLAYQHEREIRAVFFNSSTIYKQNTNEGYFIEVDLNVLVKDIVISPLAPDWFKIIIEDICAKYGFSFQVEHSINFTPPIY